MEDRVEVQILAINNEKRNLFVVFVVSKKDYMVKLSTNILKQHQSIDVLHVVYGFFNIIIQILSVLTLMFVCSLDQSCIQVDMSVLPFLS